MTESEVGKFVSQRERKFRWDFWLPRRNAWLKTLILLPFGLSVANFLGASWQFSLNTIVAEHQYVLGPISMAINILLPILFFGFLFHWFWFIWRQPGLKTWYPQTPGLAAGAYATLTIALSFGLVHLLAHHLGICDSSAWGEIGNQLVCNLDGYGFESKSWFGVWFIVAAYCYQAQGAVYAIVGGLFGRRRHRSTHSVQDGNRVRAASPLESRSVSYTEE